MSDTVLVVEDDRALREALGQTLDLAGLTPLLTGSFVEAKDHIHPSFEGVILSDIRMPGRDGFHLLDYAQDVDADLPVLLLTGEGDIPMAVRAMAQGAFTFLEKPCAGDVLVGALQQALIRRSAIMERRRQRLRSESGDAADRMVFGQSQAAQDMRAHMRKVAMMQGDVLITGDHGAGTHKIAEVIHLLSSKAAFPFVKRSAVAITRDELDAAVQAAAGGSLFLNEIGLMPQPMQYRLLELLENIPDLRLLAGMTQTTTEQGTPVNIAPDLYYRLDLLKVRIPALRERPEDIAVMFRQFVAQACEQANLPQPEIPESLITELMARDWPGNTRALMNEAMRFAMGVAQPTDEAQLGLVEKLTKVELSLLSDALARTSGNATAAAHLLKLPRKTFYDKLAKHNLSAEDFRKA